MSLRALAVHHHQPQSISVTGYRISDFSTRLLREIAAEAALHTVHITSVERTVQGQADAFYDNILSDQVATYKNPDVAKMIDGARALHKQGAGADKIRAYLADQIEHAHGGPLSVSRHIGIRITTEIFDVRRRSMSGKQARAFLAACRRRMPATITGLGHPKEFEFAHGEFPDPSCFHLEVKRELLDELKQTLRWSLQKLT